MNSHFLALPLPLSIRSRLASFCYGVPHVQWVEEENFHLVLRHFGPLSDHDAALIEERLETLFFVKFSLVLKGIGNFHSKGNRGTIWVGVEQTAELSALKKEVDLHLRELPLRAEERSFHPHITLGRYDRLSQQKLGDYLIAHADFQSEPFEVDCCQLLTSHHTPKHLYYQLVEQVNASSPATGED